MERPNKNYMGNDSISLQANFTTVMTGQAKLAQFHGRYNTYTFFKARARRQKGFMHVEPSGFISLSTALQLAVWKNVI